MQALLERMTEDTALVETELRKFFFEHDTSGTTLYKAMSYSTMCGGKRIRPFLVLEFCRMFGGTTEAALPYACAIEMIHTFSLIHDDLPCMDNDDLRRGKPTNHKVFGEASALLAGDALVFSAIECALSNSFVTADNKNLAVYELVKAAGADGMCEGQMLDMQSDAKQIEFDELLKLHAHKTGALMRVAAKLGAIAANGDNAALRAADIYGANIGLAFQIVDDVLDKYGSTDTLGKTVGSDSKNDKTTFLSFMPSEDAMEYAATVSNEACVAIYEYENSQTLCQLASYLLNRQN